MSKIKRILNIFITICICLSFGSSIIMADSNEVSFNSDGNSSVFQINSGHSVAFRFIACAAFDKISIDASSIGNNTGNLTVSIFKYLTSYDKTLRTTPLEEEEFVNFRRTDTLTMSVNCGKGDYLIVISNPVEKVGCYTSTGRGNAFGILYEDGYEIEGTLNGSVHFTEKKEQYFEKLDSAYDLTISVTTPTEIVYGDNDSVVTRNSYPSTWVGTDGLGRILPTNDETRDKKDKIVALAYWTWSCDFSKNNEPRNVSDIIEKYPEAKNDYYHEAWKETSTVNYFWNEPLWGYYSVCDRWVIRKQAELLAAAGVDVIFFDNTNSTATWQDGYRVVFDVFAEARADGINCPDISFTFGFAAGEDQRTQLREIYLDIFRQDKYRELWFYWDGKPLIMAYAGSLHKGDVLDDEIREFFTFRESLAKCNGNQQTKPGQWCWLDTYPQNMYYDESGNLEMIPVGTAINWNENGMTAFNGENVMGRAYTHDNGMNTGENSVLYGEFLAEQFEYAIEKDPEIIFVVGWNEWIAGHFETWCGVDGAFPDEFNDMYSRDIEPSNGILKDHYYYELCSYIRKFKGTDKPLSVSPEKSIDISGDVNQWNDVTPSYYASINNIGDRDSVGYVGTYYENHTGRNDITLCKVARDSENIYFYVETKDNLSDSKDPSWMMLFLDINDSNENWEGYEFVLNRVSPEKDGIVLEKATGDDFNFEKVSNVSYKVAGNILQISIPKGDLGITGDDFSINFKWADNTGIDGDIMVFYQNGDVAPLGRFNYNYNTKNTNSKINTDIKKTSNTTLVIIAASSIGVLLVIFGILLVLVMKKMKSNR